VGDREPDEVAEVDGEGQFCDRQRRFQRPIFATPPRLRFSLDPVLRCPRKIRFVIEDRFQDRARVVEGKTDAERKQTWKKQHLFHPRARVKLALRADIKHCHRHRRGKKNRNVDQESAHPAALWPARRWMQEHTQTGEEQIRKVRDQVTGRFSLNRERQLAAPDPGQEFFAGLNGAFGPAMLLGLETIHVHRQLGRRHDVGKEDKFPTSELGAIAQIEIFAKSIVLPTPGLLDARAPPKPGCAVEIKKASAPAARRLLEQEMAVQKHGLHPREQRVAAI